MDAYFVQKKKILDNFKSKLFPIKKLSKSPTPEPATESAAEPTLNVATDPTPKPIAEADQLNQEI